MHVSLFFKQFVPVELLVNPLLRARCVVPRTVNSQYLRIHYTYLIKKQVCFAQVTIEERDYIARETVGRFNNELYKKERANRLTASDFGEVIKQRSTTNPDRLVRDILSIESNVNAPGIQFAKDNEEHAIKLFEEKMNMKVQRIGLYIDIDNPYLAASPTGKVFS